MKTVMGSLMLTVRNISWKHAVILVGSQAFVAQAMAYIGGGV